MSLVLKFFWFFNSSITVCLKKKWNFHSFFTMSQIETILLYATKKFVVTSVIFVKIFTQYLIRSQNLASHFSCLKLKISATSGPILYSLLRGITNCFVTSMSLPVSGSYSVKFLFKQKFKYVSSASRYVSISKFSRALSQCN